jgi:V/A-type H+-transporting ATPase subunit A
MQILQEEAELEEIVRLVGIDALGFKDRITMECARSIREDFLHQNSFDEVDTYTSLEKQYAMLKLIITWYNKALAALEQHVHLDNLIEMPIREQIGRAKYIPEKEHKVKFAALFKDLDVAFTALTEEGDLDA